MASQAGTNNTLSSKIGQLQDRKIHRFHPEFMLIQKYNRQSNHLFVSGKLAYPNGTNVEIGRYNNFVFQTLLNSEQSFIKFMIDEVTHNLEYVSSIMKENHTDNTFQQLQQYHYSELKPKLKHLLTFLEYTGVFVNEQSEFTHRFNEIMFSTFTELDSILKQENIQEQETKQSNSLNNNVRKVQIIPLDQPKPSEMIGEEQTFFASTVKKGGYFSVARKRCKIIDPSTAQEQEKQLARKVLAERRSNQDKKEYALRIKHELEIVSQVNKAKHLLTYYVQSDNPNQIYMDFVENTINTLKSSHDKFTLSYNDLLDLALQIIESVQNLHDSGIVHRDVKPSNFLVEETRKSENKFHYQIKIIDFGESYLHKDGPEEFMRLGYGCSHPYSPLECSQTRIQAVAGLNQGNELYNEQQKKYVSPGIVNKQIDYWSVGFVIYELFFDRWPVNYSKAYVGDIRSSWPKDMLLTANQRPKHGNRFVEDIIAIMCIKMLKPEQGYRLNLRKAKKIIQMLQKKLSEIEKSLLIDTA